MAQSQGAQLLKSVLSSADDIALEQFLSGYVLGSSAEHFIGMMTAPNQRTEFFAAIAKTYPEDWQRAVEELAKEK